MFIPLLGRRVGFGRLEGWEKVCDFILESFSFRIVVSHGKLWVISRWSVASVSVGVVSF